MKRALLAALLVVAGCRSKPATRGPNDINVAPAKGGPTIAPAPCSDDAGDAATADEAYGKKVVVICMEGVRPDAKAAVETALGFQAGSVLTDKSLRDGLEAIHKTGVVDDATVYARKVGPGIALTLRLHERPRVGKVTVEGASAVNIEVKQAAEPTPLHPGQHYDPEYANDRARALREGYVSGGYEDATVTPQTTPAGDGVVDVHMVIHEGQRSRIGKITTKGVTPSLEAGMLKASGLVSGDPLDPDVVNDAPLKITAFYYDAGHVSVNVKLDRGMKGADSSVPLTLDVTEGPRFKIGKIKLGKSDLDETAAQRLVASFQSKPGAIFKRSLLVADIASVKHAFADRGRNVEVEPRTDVNSAKAIIDVELDITSP